MKVLDRHVLREFLSACVAAFSFFTLLFLALHLFTHLSDFGEAAPAFAERGYSVFVGACRYYAIALPFVLVSAGPFALLMAGMWAAQRLAKDAETVAAQAAGIGLRRFTLPMLLAGFALAAALGAIRQEALPRLSLERLRMERLVRGQAKATLGGGFVLEDGAGHRVLFSSYDPADRTAFDVEVRRRDDLARKATTARLRYDDGRWRALDPVRGDASLVAATDLNPREIEIEARGLRQLRTSELDELAARLPDRRDLQVLQHARYSYPVGAAVLAALGVGLVLRGGRRNVYAAAGLGLLVSIVYFSTESLLHGVAERELWLPPALAAWLPPLVFGAAASLVYQDL
jgi:lipopolysaccharide export LptBFGC system permease protein LptF